MFSFTQQDYLISRFAVFQVREARERFQASFGSNIKLLVLVVVRIKDGGGRKEGEKVR